MISAHVLVKNEENFVWYSIMSVINHVDKILIWDTGSTDGTLEIVRELQKTSRKIFFKKIQIDEFNEGKIRQQMLDETKDGWIIIVDGDEIWWEDSIGKIVNFIRLDGDNYESIVVPTINLVGDIYHYQEKKAGKYKLLGKKGHYNIRAINKNIPGLRAEGEYGTAGFVDQNNIKIQDRDNKRIKFIDAPYLHATHLQRTGSRSNDQKVLKRTFKLKHELGISFPLDFHYPESFFYQRSDSVPNVWNKMDLKFKMRSFFETPFRQFKRRYLSDKVGY